MIEILIDLFVGLYFLYLSVAQYHLYLRTRIEDDRIDLYLLGLITIHMLISLLGALINTELIRYIGLFMSALLFMLFAFIVFWDYFSGIKKNDDFNEDISTGQKGELVFTSKKKNKYIFPKPSPKHIFFLFMFCLFLGQLLLSFLNIHSISNK